MSRYTIESNPLAPALHHAAPVTAHAPVATGLPLAHRPADQTAESAAPCPAASTHKSPRVAASSIAVTPVRTAEGLREALREGAADIEIREHLDLRGLDVDDNPDVGPISDDKLPYLKALMYASGQTRSIRVRPRATCHPAIRVSQLMLPPCMKNSAIPAGVPLKVALPEHMFE